MADAGDCTLGEILRQASDTKVTGLAHAHHPRVDTAGRMDYVSRLTDLSYAPTDVPAHQVSELAGSYDSDLPF